MPRWVGRLRVIGRGGVTRCGRQQAPRPAAAQAAQHQALARAAPRQSPRLWGRGQTWGLGRLVASMGRTFAGRGLASRRGAGGGVFGEGG